LIFVNGPEQLQPLTGRMLAISTFRAALRSPRYNDQRGSSPNGHRYLCQDRRYQRRIPRQQAQGRDRGAVNATPSLLNACATGEHIKEATITHRKAGKGQQEFLVVTLNDVLVTGVVYAGDNSGPTSETVSPAFAKVNLEYRPQKADASFDAGIHFKYDLKANKSG
jgi:hypothetical protein